MRIAAFLLVAGALGGSLVPAHADPVEIDPDRRHR
jgi:hypothetical protein